MEPDTTERDFRALNARLTERVSELERQVADLQRHNKELREVVAALLAPTGPDFASEMRFGNPSHASKKIDRSGCGRATY